jgi:hypothetical protein
MQTMNRIYTSARRVIVATACVLHVAFGAFGQDDEDVVIDDGYKPVRSHFESSWAIDHPTVVVPSKGTLEFMIQHRFGALDKGVKDLWGIYAPANIRLGLSYTLFDNLGIGSFRGPLAIGLGTTKSKYIQDVNLRYGVFRQTRNNRVPVSVTYYGNVAIETQRKVEQLPNGRTSDRFSYFHQIMVSRRFSEELSLQIGVSASHYNVVAPEMENDHIAASLTCRYRFSAQSAVLINIDQPVTDHSLNNPQPNFGIGIEVATGSHAFQVFISSFNAIVPQRNNMFNQNEGLRIYDDSKFADWKWSGFQIGFNINRLWNF